jgi:hypothetical protein
MAVPSGSNILAFSHRITTLFYENQEAFIDFNAVLIKK